MPISGRNIKRFMDKATIIIPCYNYSHFLPQSIESALAQTWENKEIIVVDDCSTDDTEQLMAAKYPQIQYIRHPFNQGLSATRNTGLLASTGDWIMSLDADDWIDKDLLELSIEWAKSKNADIVGVWQQEFGERQDVHHFHPNPSHDDFLNGNKINCSSLFKRKVYEALMEKDGFAYDERLKKGYEDWQFWLRATKLGFIVTTVTLALFHYRIHKDSMIAGILKKDIRDEVFQEMKDSIPEIFA